MTRSDGRVSDAMGGAGLLKVLELGMSFSMSLHIVGTESRCG